MKLRCDLVTLSACESGLNRVRRGDELYGFARAFMIAGARALIVSLWRVDECSTLLLMHNFYQAVQAGTNFSTALHQAQVYLKKLQRSTAVSELADIGILPSAAGLPEGYDVDRIFADPKYWAAFIMIGDPDITHVWAQSQ
jgi:CHAT domain-containing protein